VAFTPEVALDYLAGAQKRGRLAHAYLITGPPGSGKHALAAEFAHLVNGAPAETLGGHVSLARALTPMPSLSARR